MQNHERREFTFGPLVTGAGQTQWAWMPTPYPDDEGPDGSGAGAYPPPARSGFITSVQARLGVSGLTLTSFRIIIAKPLTLALRDVSDAADVEYSPVDILTNHPERIAYDSTAITTGLTDGALPVEDAPADESATFGGPCIVGIITSSSGTADAGDFVVLSIGSREE